MTEKQNTAFGPEDVRFTQRDGALYAILLGWPGNRAVLKSLGSTSELANRITRIDLLGGPTDLNWTQTPEGLAINLPDDPVGEHAFTLRAQIR